MNGNSLDILYNSIPLFSSSCQDSLICRESIKLLFSNFFAWLLGIDIITWKAFRFLGGRLFIWFPISRYARFVRFVFVVYEVSFVDGGTNRFFRKSGLRLNNQKIGKLLTSLQILLIILQICRIIMGVWSFVLKGGSLLDCFKLFAGVRFGGLKG